MNFVIFVNRKYLKVISPVKTTKKTQNFSKKEYRFFETNFLSSFLIYIPVLVISFLLHINLIHKIWVDLINERQQETRRFLGKISEAHGINLSRGQSVLPENCNYLNPTELLNLCCSVVPFIPLGCGSIAVV